MSDRATHEMVVSFIREFQANRDELVRQLLAMDDRVRKIEARMTDVEALVKNFSGRLNGMESRLGERAKQASVDAILDTIKSHDQIYLAKFEAQQAANKALREYVYNQDFDREFNLANALDATL